MKQSAAFFIAIVLVAFTVLTSFAAAADEFSDEFSNMLSVSSQGDRAYTYSTAAMDVYNFAHINLSGTTIQIQRRSYQTASIPDEISIRLGGASILSRSIEWAEGYVEGSYRGYDTALDVSSLADGTYQLALESSASENAGESDVFFVFPLATVSFVKQGKQCYFPATHTLSNRYNYGLLQQLQNGKAPNDFAVLKKEYEKLDNAQVLAAIEAKAKEVTDGSYSDLDKCLSVYQWIVGNIAYDFAFPRDRVDQWLEAHPEDSIRFDDPLCAFDRKYAMCYGYAKLTTLMLGYVGVDSVYVKGRLADDISKDLAGIELSDDFNHAWNAVKISGSWYYLDTCMDALYGYYRTNSNDAATGYLEVNRGLSRTYAFPSLGQISNTHIAMRYGAEKYGEKVPETEIPEGLKEVSSALQYYINGTKVQKQWLRIDGNVYYFDRQGKAMTGWNIVDGYWRCFGNDGVLLIGVQALEEDGVTQTYQFDNEGCITGDYELITFGGVTRYYRGKEMIKGWAVADESLRYFQTNGAMYTGSSPVFNENDGVWYTFTNDGVATPDNSGEY